LFFIFCIVSCGHTFSVKPPATSSSPPPPISAPSSTINLPVTVSLSQVTPLLDQNLPSELKFWGANDMNFGCGPGASCGVRWWYQRHPLTLSMSGNTLHVQIPGQFAAQLMKGNIHLAGCGGTPPIPNGVRADANVDSQVKIVSWHLTSASSLVNPLNGLN